MFTLNHFIWLFISLAVILTVVILNIKLNLSFKFNLNILFIVSLLSEIVKTLVCMKLEVPNKDGVVGTYLNPGDLPFHLCSMQVFFVIALKFFIKKESTKNVLLSFMFPTMLIGGTLSMLIPTVGVSFTNPQVYQYFLFHAYIVGFAIYLISKKIITIETKTLFRNLGILFGIMFIGIWINSMLSDKAVNFLYLSRPPMDNLPLLNLDHGWYVYFFTLIGIAVILMMLLHIPFIIVNNHKKKTIK